MKANLRDPSFVGALVYFERVAAAGSFSRAATELGVTTSAVSHRVRRLEEALGHRLFHRAPGAVVLTEAGATLQTATKTALSRIAGAVDMLSAVRTLRLSVGPYLSVAWLMPRLGDFEAANPRLVVDLVHRVGRPKMNDVDVAIFWADTTAVPDGAEPLFSPTMVPVAAPGLTTPAPVWEQRLAPLHYRSRAPWTIWLNRAGGPRAFAAKGEIFDDPNLVLEAAAHGRGIALGFAPFCLEPMRKGRIARLSGIFARSTESYWLVLSNPADPDAVQLAAWLRAAARETTSIQDE